MGQNKGTDETTTQKSMNSEDELDTLITSLIADIKAKRDKELDRISEDLTFTMVALCIIAVLLLITAIFLIFVINRVGL
ncbi:hypothetical protein [Weissella paramesenteroides]|uniref:hypothetical protein n=1 Tax=Weissella paramesenteroides TaxID=1249 RepID=UPI00376F063D